MTMIETAPTAVHIGARRAAVRRHRRRQQAQGDPGEGARGPLDRREHLPGRLRGADAPAHRPGVGLHDLGRVEVQGVRLREPRRVVPVRARGLGAHAAVHRGRHPGVVPHVRREPQPRRRRQRRVASPTAPGRSPRTTCCARRRACRARTSSSTDGARARGLRLRDRPPTTSSTASTCPAAPRSSPARRPGSAARRRGRWPSTGAHVVLAVRDADGKGAAAATAIREQVPGASVEVAELDLTSLDSVRAFAKRFLDAHDRHRPARQQRGRDGDTVRPHRRGPRAAVRHQPPRPLPAHQPAHARAARRRARPGSSTSASAGHFGSDIVWDDVDYEHRPYDKWEAYGQSKTANILFSGRARPPPRRQGCALVRGASGHDRHRARPSPEPRRHQGAGGAGQVARHRAARVQDRSSRARRRRCGPRRRPSWPTSAASTARTATSARTTRPGPSIPRARRVLWAALRGHGRPGVPRGLTRPGSRRVQAGARRRKIVTEPSWASARV